VNASVQVQQGECAGIKCADHYRYLNQHQWFTDHGYLYDYPDGPHGCVGAAVAVVITVNPAPVSQQIRLKRSAVVQQ